MLELSWVHLIVFTTVLASLLLGGVLFFHPYFRSRANRYLGFTFWIVALLATTYGLLTAGVEHKAIVITNDVMWEYLFPVTLLFYFAHSLSAKLRQSLWRFLLYLPFFLTLLLNLAIDFDLDLGYYHWEFAHDDTRLERYYLVEQLGLIPFAGGILVWIYLLIQRYPPPVPTDWFKRFWVMLVVAVGFWIISMLVEISWQIDIAAVLWGVIAIIILWTTYQGVLHFKLAEEGVAIRGLLAAQEAPPPPPKVDTLPSTNYVEQLKERLEQEHWYRDPSLSRDSVAHRLGISSGYLSQQFNAHSPSQSFTDLIRQYRVTEAQRLLHQEAFAPYSILAIGFEAGFNSKSTFYTAFKKVTGLTPTAYRAQQQQTS